MTVVEVSLVKGGNGGSQAGKGGVIAIHAKPNWPGVEIHFRTEMVSSRVSVYVMRTIEHD
jgi:hypothetical protein